MEVLLKWDVPYALLLIGSLAAGCDPIPAGNPLEPAAVTDPVQQPAEAPVEPGFDFDADGRDGDEGKGEEDPIALQARLLGMAPDEVPAPTPAAEPAPPAPAPSPAPAVPAVPAWSGEPVAAAGWGVRVLSTIHDVQPPRAILGMADGTEEVVRPGTLLPEQQIVVLAVGRDVVQIARVEPDGYATRIQSQTLSAMFPGRATPTAPRPD